MLVSIEGIDGSGKTALIEGAATHDGLKEAFPDALYTTEPEDNTWLGTHVRTAISQKPPDLSSTSTLFLFLAEHAHHVENTVRPALQDNRLVFTDRYIDSRYAYQSFEIQGDIDGDELDWIRHIQEQPWTEMPDLTLLLDVPVDVALERVVGDEIFEKKEKLRQYRKTYLQLSETLDRYRVIDATQEPSTIREEAVNAVRQRHME